MEDVRRHHLQADPLGRAARGDHHHHAAGPPFDPRRRCAGQGGERQDRGSEKAHRGLRSGCYRYLSQTPADPASPSPHAAEPCASALQRSKSFAPCLPLRADVYLGSTRDAQWLSALQSSARPFDVRV
jgi:hypothetical protein